MSGQSGSAIDRRSLLAGFAGGVVATVAGVSATSSSGTEEPEPLGASIVWRNRTDLEGLTCRGTADVYLGEADRVVIEMADKGVSVARDRTVYFGPIHHPADVRVFAVSFEENRIETMVVGRLTLECEVTDR